MSDKNNLSPKAKTGLKATGVVVLFGLLSWVAVPFYDWFCSVTGYGGRTMVAQAESEIVLDREIVVRFNASVADKMPWRFRAVEPEMRVKIGETALAFYEATNLSDRPMAASSAYNVAPYAAGEFFQKIECFCLTEQVLQPGETILLPVSYFIDPEIVNHPEAKHISAVTLGYTFYEIPLPEGDRQASLSVSDANAPLTDGATRAIDNN